MKTTNIPSGAQRISNVGLQWEEKITNGTGTLHLPAQSTIRVRATGATTVTIDGVLAMTMSAGEIEYFNVGYGTPGDGISTVKVDIAGAAAFVQVASEFDPGRRTR